MEEVVANVDELGLQVGADELGAPGTVGTELSDDLANAAAQIEKNITRTRDVETEEGLLVTRVLGV